MNLLYSTPPELCLSELLPVQPRLLVVDDQPINIQVLYQIFHDDHEIFMATDGQQALEVCRRELPDLILLDVVMPDMDGLDVCRHLKSDPLTADIPVIFVTAQNESADETHALEVGAVDFISKPVNPAVVRARVRTHLTLKAQADRLRSLAFIDGLTGVANRRRFDETLEAEWRRCWRSGLPLALMMIDVDHFKNYNDHYGHQQGDLCLQTVANSLRQHFRRPHDLVARYGGEEFVCLLPECNLSGAAPHAEALRLAVLELRIPHAKSPTANQITISLGVAMAIPNAETSPHQFIAMADARLYAAKSAGRNQVCAAELSAT